MTYIQAKNYTATRGRSIDLGILHDMEMPESATTAEACANFFHNQAKGPSGSSAHYCCDNNSTVQCVKDKDVAWHAPGANHDGIGIEEAGYARQGRRAGMDKNSKQILDKQVIPLLARICKQYKIPPVFLTAPALVAQRRGISTHWQGTKAVSHGQGDTDAGLNYPIAYVIHGVQKKLSVSAKDAPNHGVPVKKPHPTLKLGAKGF